MKVNKQDIIENLTKDLCSNIRLANIKKDILGLYSDRSSFYDKTKVNCKPGLSVIGCTDKATYRKLYSVLSMHRDKYTREYIVDRFYPYFFDACMFGVGDESADGSTIIKSFPEHLSFVAMHDLGFFADYIMNVCDVDLGSLIMERVEQSIDKCLSKEYMGMKNTPNLSKFYMDAKEYFLQCAVDMKNHVMVMYDKKFSHSESDKVLCAKIDTKNDFYQDCLASLRMVFDPNYGLKEQSLMNFYMDAQFGINNDIRNAYYNNSILSKGFTSLPENISEDGGLPLRLSSAVEPPKQAQTRFQIYTMMRFYLTQALIFSQKYSDDLRMMEITTLSEQEIVNVLNSVIAFASIQDHMDDPYSVEYCSPEYYLLINNMVRGCFEMILRKNRYNSVNVLLNQIEKLEKGAASNKPKENVQTSSKSSVDKLINKNNELEQEIRRLRNDLKDKKNIEKSYKSEISELRKEYETKLSEMKDELDRTISEKTALEEQIIDDELEQNNDSITKADIMSALKGKKVLVWGLRPETADKLNKEYPDALNCVALDSSHKDVDIPVSLLESSDAAIIVTSYAGHGSYWKARDMIKESGIPYAHARKNTNNPERFGRLMYKILTEETHRNIE